MELIEEDAGSYDVFARTCPSRSTLEHVTGRWGSLVLGALGPGPLRFNELRRRVDGVNQKILAQTLQALERDGFVERDLISTFPLRVEYSLTPIGESVTQRLLSLFTHLEAQMPAVLDAQRRYARRADQSSSPRGSERISDSQNTTTGFAATPDAESTNPRPRRSSTPRR